MSIDRTLTRCLGSLLTVLAVIAAHPFPAQAEPGEVLSHQKISSTEGGFVGPLDDDDRFGVQITTLGDFDGDGVVDIAVGAALDDDGGQDRGAVWILFLNSDGTVKAEQKISSTEGGFTGILHNYDLFARAASLGDLDGDGVGDLAVGAPGDDDPNYNFGAVWILFLNSDGTVKAHQKISATEGGFSGELSNNDQFGWSVATLPDLDGDEVADLAVGALNDDDGDADVGAVWILFLNNDGTVKAHQKISATEGGFTGILEVEDRFGHGVAPLEDLDDDGVADLAVGAFGDDDGFQEAGAVWILFLNSDGTVKGHQKISATEGGFTGPLHAGDLFARVTSLGDVDADGVQDLAVGAQDDDGGLNRGAVWILFLNSDGTVKGHQKISSTQGGFTGPLHYGDWFGWSGAWLGDLNGDSYGDLAVGALWDDDGGPDRGAVWILFLDGSTSSVDPDAVPRGALSFAGNPNPFGAQTVLQYVLPTATSVRLVVHDPSGRRVASLVDRVEDAGPHSVTWDGRNDAGEKVASGIYFCHIEAGNVKQTRSIVLTR